MGNGETCGFGGGGGGVAAIPLQLGKEGASNINFVVLGIWTLVRVASGGGVAAWVSCSFVSCGGVLSWTWAIGHSSDLRERH